MRGLIGAIAVAALVGSGAVALTTGPATAERIRSVEFAGTSVFEFLESGCSFVHQNYDATLTTNRGDTMHLEGCVELVGIPFPLTGTFVIDSPGRRDITGTVSGLVGTQASGTCDAGLGATGLDFELTPTTDTRRPHPPAPPLHLDGTWCSSAVPGVAGPISGTLTGALPPGMG
jgi:hypothetical protein